VPRRGEFITLAGLNFFVMHTKAGAVRWFKVVRDPAADSLLRS
jgi:magnesium and cobalt transporter